MKKIIRLTENDLVRLVKKVIKEQKLGGEIMSGTSNKLMVRDCDTSTITVVDSVNSITIEVDSNIKLPIMGKLRAPSETNSTENGVMVGIIDNSEKLSSYLRNVLGSLSLQIMADRIKDTKTDEKPDPNKLNEIVTGLVAIRNRFTNNYSDSFQNDSPTSAEIDRFITMVLSRFDSVQLNTLIQNIQKVQSELDDYVKKLAKDFRIDLPTSSNEKLDKVKFNEKIKIMTWINMSSGDPTTTKEQRNAVYQNICSVLNQYLNSGNASQNGVVTIPSIQYLATMYPNLEKSLRLVAGQPGGSVVDIVNKYKINYKKVIVVINTISPNRISTPKQINLS
jgi:hypothetical protein